MSQWIDGKHVKVGLNISFKYMLEQGSIYYKIPCSGIINDIVEDCNDFQYVEIAGQYYCTQYFVKNSLEVNYNDKAV